ncbi:hypothetical protein BN971_00549 [Mycobacterium bohemicum DSM 44277]|uniref:Dihydrodipicolinate reductase n=2 Tax=Mycobacterium bohemicum TaxID=56425 RepID=A0A1X1R478_MYCBE|nr:dihydrodipicolinate reductase [Mycobacterium bohemicum]MCV6968461.1 dihydrodipicolinate reductase [Mycobacterium bohemicum]ORU99131.1 dihydrodipicolinate reductase [Mycobacterium bohemicum]CPR05262.1 hypothetical protein BN971_00549 [Mycobacterium bohemicum DSM 44277]
MKTYRVVQWSTGTVGRRSLQAVIDHPELDLVGLYAHGEKKIGKDAGELVDRPATGVTASNDVDALIGLAPDCVIYEPNVLDFELACRFLDAGINVVTTGDFVTGSHRRTERDALEAACRRGRTTFLGTGSEPGFINVLAGFLTGSCRRVHSVRLIETFDATTYPVPQAWRAMGFGRPIGTRSEPIDSGPSALGLGYFETLDLVAGMMALELEATEGYVEHAAATRDIDLGWMRFPEGTVAGQRRVYRGLAHGRVVVELETCWTMSRDALDPQWGEPERFRIEIEGEPRVEATLNFTMPRTSGLSQEPDATSMLTVLTAMAAVHAVPFVCDADPGVMRPSDLPIYGARHCVV